MIVLNIKLKLNINSSRRDLKKKNETFLTFIIKNINIKYKKLK